MERLIWRAKNERADKKDVWPEYSSFPVSLVTTRWAGERQLAAGHGYVGRRPGDPAWNSSRYAVFRVLAKQIDAANAQELDRQLLVVSNEMSKLNPDAMPSRQRHRPRRRGAADCRAMATMPYDQPVALRILQRISDDAENIALRMSVRRNKRRWR